MCSAASLNTVSSPVSSEYSRIRFVWMSLKRTARRWGSQTGPSAQVAPVATFSSVAPGVRRADEG